MAAIYVNGVPYEYMAGYCVRFPDDWQGEMTEVRLTDKIEGSRIRNLYISHLPDTIRKLYIPAGIVSLSFANDFHHELETVEVDTANKMYSTDGHALYSADGKRLIRLLNHQIETYEIASQTEHIDCEAFDYCTRLKKIIVPAGVVTLDTYDYGCKGFALGCRALEELEIAEDNPVFWTDGKAIYSKDKKTLYFLAVDGLERYAVADGTEKVMGYAFNGREGLKRVSLPTSVRDVADLQCDGHKNHLDYDVSEENSYIMYQNDAFYSADGKHLILATRDVQSYTVRPGVEVIDSRAFRYVRSLKKVVLPEGIREIGEHAFVSCKKLETVGCQENTPEMQFLFPESLERIGDCAFSEGEKYYREAKVENTVIGKNIVSIGEKAFASFRGNRFIVLGCPELGDRVFENMHVKSLLLPCINPTKIKKSIQELAVRSYCEAMLRGEACCEAGKKPYMAYLKRNSKRYVDQMIKYQNHPLASMNADKVTESQNIIRVMLINKLVEDTQIDEIVENTDGEKYAAFKAELVDYAGEFASDGAERMMKQFEQEIKKEESKQKREEKKVSFESLPLAARVATKNKLGTQAKVELLEEAVLHGTIEDLQNVFKVHGPFEFTARALAMAARCRTADYTEELLKNGATFTYEATAGFTRKYNCIIKETNRYSYPFNYAALILERMDWRMKIERLADMQVSPMEERCRSLALICAAKKDEDALKNLLYQAILRGEANIVRVLKAAGVDQLSAYDASTAFQNSFVSMDAASICERNTFYGSMAWDEPDKLRWQFDELLMARPESAIHFSRPELTNWDKQLPALCSEKVFELVIEGKVDVSKAKPSELISACLKAGNIKGLQYALDQNWAADKKAISKTAKRLGIEDAAVLKWLNC